MAYVPEKLLEPLNPKPPRGSFETLPKVDALRKLLAYYAEQGRVFHSSNHSLELVANATRRQLELERAGFRRYGAANSSIWLPPASPLTEEQWAKHGPELLSYFEAALTTQASQAEAELTVAVLIQLAAARIIALLPEQPDPEPDPEPEPEPTPTPEVNLGAE